MSTVPLTLTVPDSLARELDSVEEDLLVDLLERGLREFKIEQALGRYARGGISFGAAARQAGVSRSEFARRAYARGMEPPSSAETISEELTMVQQHTISLFGPSTNDPRFSSLLDLAAGRPPVDWLWPGQIPRGMITLLAAAPGTGNSLVALDLARRIIAVPNQKARSLAIRSRLSQWLVQVL